VDADAWNEAKESDKVVLAGPGAGPGQDRTLAISIINRVT
jgi:hypothetical protein